MAAVVQPSKNKMLDAAWKGFRKEQRSEKKTKEEVVQVKSKNARERKKGGK